MTPDRSKRSLPSSTSMVFPERPATYQEWKTALQRIKVLYLRGQWKQCTARCNQLLLEAKIPPYPLHATSLHFYSALSNEVTARLSHPLSAAKLHTLEQARSSYHSAAASLPAADLYHYADETYDDSLSTISSSPSDESEILDYYRASPGATTPLNEPSSPSSVESMTLPQDNPPLKPSPLRIRKLTIPTPEHTFNNPSNHLPFPSPIFNLPPPTPPPTHPLPTPSPTTTTTHHIRSTHSRYNSHLASFATMLAHHIHTINALIKTTQEAQAMRYFAKRLASYGDHDEAARAADLKARIVRLRAAGWRRERFVPGRYREICERALEEL